MLVILNYLVRAMVILIGVILIVKPLPIIEQDENFIKVFGIITIFFGVFRTIIYHRKRILLKQEQKVNDENSEA